MGNKKGLIVCFDGPDGVGKTTQLKLAATALTEEGYEVFTVKAIGGLPLTDILGQALMQDNQRPPETDLHVAIASQYALAAEILPRRKQGQIILVDRSPLSIIAYQVYADGLKKDQGYDAVVDLLELLNPDLLITYYLDAETALQRRSYRDGDIDRNYFESKPISYHQKTADGFKAAAKDFGAETIDASPPIELVREATMQLIGAKLKA